MPILATLGSDKSVTTINAILTEIFTGLNPNKIIIFREDSPKKDIKGMEKVLKYLGINASIEEKVIGEGIKLWREKIRNEEINIFDITPGRKYMALSATYYSRAEEIRYVYLKDEREGYHIFGYVPFEQLKVINVRTGDEISYDPPLTQNVNEAESLLDVDSLRAFINILGLHGKVEINGIDLENPDQVEEICLFRSGKYKYEEEKDIVKEAERGSLFLADTNVYIRLGNRLRSLVHTKKYGFRLLSSKNTFNELYNHTAQDTQKIDENKVKFILGMLSYRSLHVPPITSQVRSSGDMGLINEALEIKKNVEDNVVLITADKALGLTAQSKGLRTIILSKVRKEIGEGDIGELLFCLSFYNDYLSDIKRTIEILLNGSKIAELHSYYHLQERRVKVRVVDKRYNYPKILEILSEILAT